MQMVKSFAVIFAVFSAWLWGTSASVQPKVAGNNAPVTAGLRFAVARLADEEPAWRAEARKMFPGDTWSQGDHFGNVERGKAQQIASQFNVSLATVLGAIDDDVHAARSPERGQVAVCVPRPFYD